MKQFLMTTLIGLSVLAPAPVAIAASTPMGMSTDGRVKTVVYNENDVISLKGYYGYQTTVSFSPSEKIQNISIGDSIAWQVVPNKAGNILFIKPVEERATTNMTVITDRRIYNFELTSGLAGSPRDNSITYMLRFTYPMDTVTDYSHTNIEIYDRAAAMERPYAPRSAITKTGVTAVGAPKDLNFQYSFKGEDDLAPSIVFDNGEFTYFKFRDMDDLPAIFEVDRDRNESVVNYHIENGYMVVAGLGRQFTLRHGELESCVFNDARDNGVPLFAMRGAN